MSLRYFSAVNSAIQGFLSTFLFAAVAGASPCDLARSIKDLVECQNELLSGITGPAVSDFISRLAPKGAVACTKSRASAQPAAPHLGDLRCFVVLPSGATVSFNLVEDINENHIEVSEVKSLGALSGVVLGYFKMDASAVLADVLSSSTEPFMGTRMTCASCHSPVGNRRVEVDGGSSWLLRPIKINSTLRDTIPTNGQVRPEQLVQELEQLSVRHDCRQRSESETCRRIAIVMAAPKRLPLENP